jgi:glyoxylase-like metal-dependent hydrolase (beta-lactamase superfamily II)
MTLLRIATCALLALFALKSAAAPLAEPEVVKLNDRVYALLGPLGTPNAHNQGYMVNATLIIGDQGAILVDTGSTDEIGQHLAKTAARLTAKPITHVINTHHHGDHVLGNAAFDKATIISSEQCREWVGKTGQEWIARMEALVGRKFPHTRAIPASVTFKEDSMTEQVINGVKLVFWVPLGSHSPSDMLVYLPEDKLLIGGDVLVKNITPNMMDGHLRNWIATLARVGTFDAKAIVPGHGPIMTQADATRMHDSLARFYAAVEAGYKKGLTDSEVRKTLDLSEWQNLVNFDTSMGINVNRAYLEAEAANF